jgi:divalent metal cation (Fe/Co/Zn/Cd) transporter
MSSPPASERQRLLAAAVGWSAATFLWASLSGLSALALGVASSSLALVGFGANSVLDATASAVLVWRFRHEHGGGEAAAVERRAAFAIGVVMLAVSLYLAVRAVISLSEHSVPEESVPGIVLSACAVFVLGVLARAKLRLAFRLDSPGLRGDGVLSLAGALLAAATLASVALDHAFGWWWSDAAVALLIAALLALEGSRTVATARSFDR